MMESYILSFLGFVIGGLGVLIETFIGKQQAILFIGMGFLGICFIIINKKQETEK